MRKNVIHRIIQNRNNYKPFILDYFMGIAAVKIKIMPVSPDADLENIKSTAKSIIEKDGGKNCSFEEEPIAFGLKALIAMFAWPEEKELEELENKLKEVEEVNSIQVADIRRAFG